jgi:hypothetical protein
MDGTQWGAGLMLNAYTAAQTKENEYAMLVGVANVLVNADLIS